MRGVGLGLILALFGTLRAAEAVPAAAAGAAAPAHVIRVPLPITGEVDNRVRGMIEQLLAQWPEGPRRPILILQFGGGADKTGRGSQFERALALARFLLDPRLARVRTIAYLEGPVEGHAVLPVLACEEIAAHPDAALGRAGLDEPAVGEVLRRAYSEMAEARRTIPAPVALAMLEARSAVYKVQTLDGVRFVPAAELNEVKQKAVVQAEKRIVAEGDLAVFSGAALRLELGLPSHLARDRRELAAVLGLSPTALVEDPTLGKTRRAVLIEVSGPMEAETVGWIERSVRDEIERNRANFLCVTIDSAGGSLADSMTLANFLASLKPGEVRTVAYVATEARADAALIALACDELVMAQDAVLGGPGARRIPPKRLEEAKTPLRELARQKGRDWSLWVALLDPQMVIRRYEHGTTGQPRFLGDEEVQEEQSGDAWKAGAEVDTATGVTGAAAVTLQLAKVTAEGFDQVRQLYHLDDDLILIRPTWAHAVVLFLASPKVAGALLFIAWFALMVEFSSPGLSLAGLVSAVCFLLFFWARFLHGEAGWLEVLLFAAGVTCVVLEIFVLPGFGVFGFAGVLLIVASIVLASQTFVIPRNAYEWTQLRTSLFLVIAGFAGALTALFVMRRAVARAPVLRRVSLETPDPQRRQEIQYQEALVHREYLAGKPGVTVTQLTPSGKARFGSETVDVISEGDIVPVGTAVWVVEVRGNEVVVRPVDSG